MHLHQKIKAIELLIKLKNDSAFFEKKLKSYSERHINVDTVEEILCSIEPVSKTEIVNNISEYVCRSFLNSFENKKKVIQDIMDVTMLSGNHDRVLVDKTGQKWFLETTTGTTGKPFPVVKSAKTRMVEASYLMRKRREQCKSVSVNNGFLLIHQVDTYLKDLNYRDDRLKNRNDIYLKIIEKLLRDKPIWIFSSYIILNILIECAARNGYERDLRNACIKFIEITGAWLLDEERSMIERAFGCRIINNYGCREAWNIGYECYCSNLHVNSSYLIVDIQKNGSFGELLGYEEYGDVLITHLENTIFPIVRYSIGDIAKIQKNERCKCGVSDDVILLAEGRITDKIKNTNIWGNAFFRRVLRALYFHDSIVDVENIKIVQDKNYHIMIYVNELISPTLFKERFVQVSKFISSEMEKFEFSFKYCDKESFENKHNIMKDQVFFLSETLK